MIEAFEKKAVEEVEKSIGETNKKRCEYPSGGLSSFKSPLGRIII